VDVHFVDPDAHDPVVARSYDLLGGKQIGQIDLELVSDLQGLLPYDDENKKVMESVASKIITLVEGSSDNVIAAVFPRSQL